MRVPKDDHDANDAARYLVALWTRTNALTLPVAVGAPRSGMTNTPTISFRRRSGFGPEAYTIEVTSQRITVSASSATGLFYGAVTLWQLLPPGGNAGQVPAQTIRDAPTYAWRGLMLDSARHLQSPAFIRSMIDWMAWHKLNVLHWHLTDDQGWRLQICKYPRLTSVGAWRVDPDGVRYGGFYSQDEVRDILRFSATRHVRIVPEIDLPGHATAAIAAYPFLGASADSEADAGSGADAGAQAGRGAGAQASTDTAPGSSAPAPAVSASWGVHTHLLNLEPRTFRFLEDVLDEVIALFPGPDIHIGGDETVKDEWKASRQVQARAHQLGIRDSDALQAYFTQRVGRYLAARGRRIIGWDEILQPGLPKGAIVMSWHGVSGAHDAAVAGHDAILTPWPTLYFDNRQSTLATEPPGRLRVVSLEDVYRFEPHDAALSTAQQRHVLGLQANLWTEHIRTEQRLQWMALPRAAALAEVGWSAPQLRSWPDFLERLAPMFARYRAFGLNYSDSVFAPAAEISGGAGGAKDYTVTLSDQAAAQSDRTQVQVNSVGGAAAVGDIRFTLDGREPSAQSTRYAAALTVPVGTEIRAAAFVGSEQVSRTWAQRFDARAALFRDSHNLELCSDSIGLLLESAHGGEHSASAAAPSPLAVDIMNPCWIDHGVDLSGGPRLIASVAPLPFNFEIGADAAKIRVGDSRSAEGELEIHIDGCDTPASVLVPLAPAADARGTMVLPAQQLPSLPGRHDLCLRFARPRLAPLWALDWVEIGE